MILLYDAADIIERDALLDHLEANGLNPESEHRDMSRKMTSGSVDLTLGGYSVVSGGYPVFIPQEQETRAKELLKDFLSESRKETPSYRNSNHYERFMKCTAFTFFVPGVFHVLGIYHLLQGARKQEKSTGWKFKASLCIFVVTGILVGFLAVDWISRFFHRNVF